MAEINTKYLGTLSYTPEEVLHFEDGLFGFEEDQQFLLIRFVNDISSMLCLQSIDEESLAFVVINPFYYIPDYAPILAPTVMASLQADDTDNLLLYVICTMQEDMTKSTANLKCPIVVNTNRGNIAKQIILDDSSYSFKHLFGTLNPNGGAL